MSEVEQAIALCDQQFSNMDAAFDVNLLEKIVGVMYNPASDAQSRNKVGVFLQHLTTSLHTWKRVPQAITQTNDEYTSFFLLQILEHLTRYRWESLAPPEREGMRVFITQIITRSVDEPNALQSKRVFIGKLNLILVHILKHEWPHNWPNFVEGLVNHSTTSEVQCENNMAILKLLSEEVYEFSKESMTSTKTNTMKGQMEKEIADIFKLAMLIFNNADKMQVTTLRAGLEGVQRFLRWVPINFIFDSSILERMVSFMQHPSLRVQCVTCLVEIVSMPDIAQNMQYVKVVHMMFSAFLEIMVQILPLHVGPQQFDNNAALPLQLSQLLSAFFRHYLGTMEMNHEMIARAPAKPFILEGLAYMVMLSRVADEQVFKVCVEFWHFFSSDLLRTVEPNILRMGGQDSQRKDRYAAMLHHVRLILISRMAKPEEVLIIVDDNGDVCRETTKDTENLALYKMMKQCLVNVTGLDTDDTQKVMLMKLTSQVDGSDWSHNNLNTLCWAIGSVSTCFHVDEEKRFLVTVIKDLLSLCEKKKGKDNKAVIASCIMYVVGQYPRFLREHWKFLKTVVNKLFEFMHENHPGVQDMACDTFLKIAQKCTVKFSQQQQNEELNFIEGELLPELTKTIQDLEAHQVVSFYEAVGTMLQPNSINPEKRGEMLMSLMAPANIVWERFLSEGQQNISILSSVDCARRLTQMFRLNLAVCKSLGNGYFFQFRKIFQDMIQMYKAVSSQINQLVQSQGEHALNKAQAKTMMCLRREVLRLAHCYIEKNEDSNHILNNVIGPMLSPEVEFLQDFNRCHPLTREPEVLSLLAVMVTNLKTNFNQFVAPVMEAVFDSTINMISVNMEDFPEMRANFFKFIEALNEHCFLALFSIKPEQLTMLIGSISWAIKHRDRNVGETGLEIMFQLINHVTQSPQVEQAFYKTFFMTILTDIVEVLTDREHKSGFKMHTQILKLLFTLVTQGKVQVPLAGDPSQGDNITFVQQSMAVTLEKAFPHMSKEGIFQFVKGCAEFSKQPFDDQNSMRDFKTLVRDFLVQMKEFAGTNLSEFNSAEGLQTAVMDDDF